MKKTRKLVTLVTVLILGLSLVSFAQKTTRLKSSSVEAKQVESKSDRKNKIIIGHRGACGYVPEHTLESYSLAYAMGADYIEADVVLTKDNVPIVLHDITLDDVTNVASIFPDRKRSDGKYYAIDFTLNEIKKLSVHERVDLKTGKQVFEGRFPLGKSHFEVPTLQEEIELIQGLNKSTGKDVGFYPEIKEPKFHTDNGKDINFVVFNFLDKYGYNKADAKCYVQCFDPAYLKNFREKLGAKMPLIQLIGEEADCPGANYKQMMTADGLKKVAEYANGIGPWYAQIVNENGEQKEDKYVTNPNLVKDAHKAKLLVHPYTFRKDQLPKYSKTMEEQVRFFLYDVGVDGLFTDFADLGVKAANEGPLKK